MGAGAGGSGGCSQQQEPVEVGPQRPGAPSVAGELGAGGELRARVGALGALRAVAEVRDTPGGCRCRNEGGKEEWQVQWSPKAMQKTYFMMLYGPHRPGSQC